VVDDTILSIDLFSKGPVDVTNPYLILYPSITPVGFCHDNKILLDVFISIFALNTVNGPICGYCGDNIIGSDVPLESGVDAVTVILYNLPDSIF
jgi:hypothetical protein